MSQAPETTGYDSDEEEPRKRGKRTADHWMTELAAAEKELRRFWERGRRVIKRYMDENDSASGDSAGRYNLFWSNVGVLKASLYANPPHPLVKRKYDDFMDDVARTAAIMMERLLWQGTTHPENDIQSAFVYTVEDRLIPGLGQIWFRYTPEIHTNEVEPAIMRGKREIKAAVTEDVIVDEHVATDYVYWEDFLWSPARSWREVWWVARRVWMSRRDFVKRFGEALAKKVTWTKKSSTRYGERVQPESMGQEKTEVFEIWNKNNKTVCFVSKNCSEYLDEVADPLELDDFWPCPEPLLATHTTSSLVPKADYLMAQTQYKRLDSLEVRIGLLQDAVRAAGVYDKSNAELGQLLGTAPMNKMIPVENWAMFAEKGGIKGVVDWFPVEQVVEALDKLREIFNEEKMKLYELTGISDIMRGTTSPRETFGAQRLKAQYSSVRLQYLQNEVANFIQNGFRIKAEIISKHFQPENIVKNSLIEFTPDAQYAEAAAQLLKDDFARCYRIEVHADTLSIPDFQAEQSARIEFITAVGQFLSQSTQMIQFAPEAGPFLIRILQWGIASFRSAQGVEGVFDQAAKALEMKLKQPPPPPKPDPKLIQAQNDTMETQVEAEKTKVETAILQKELAVGDQSEMAKVEGEKAKAVIDLQTQREKNAMQLQAQREKTAASIDDTRMKTAANVQALREKTAANTQALGAKTVATIQADRLRAMNKPKGGNNAA